MHDALDIVDQVMELALEDGFEVRLHLTAGHFNEDRNWQVLALFDI